MTPRPQPALSKSARFGATVAAILCTLPASAAEPTFANGQQETRIWLGVDGLVPPGGTAPPVGAIVPMELGGQVMVHPNIAIDFVIPWLVNSTPGPVGPNQATFITPGNLSVGFHVVDTFFPRPDTSEALWSGLSISLPVLEAGSASSVLSREVLANNALDHLATDRYGGAGMIIRIPLGVEGRSGNWLRYRFEIDLDIPGGSLFGASLLQAMIEVEARLPAHVVLGVHLAGTISEAGGVEPYVGYDPPGPGLFFRAGMMFGAYVGSYDWPAGSNTTVLTQLGVKF